jgi:hypothetical protein
MSLLMLLMLLPLLCGSERGGNVTDSSNSASRSESNVPLK